MDDTSKLHVLLPHWIAHNAEHAQEYRSWAARARDMGAQAVAQLIEAAAAKADAANRDLEEAVRRLGGHSGVTIASG